MKTPILYTFRRCPYAIRARLALYYAGIRIELREILLKDKPPAMLELSSKATVPVLQLANGVVLDESLDVIHWALSQSDRDYWLPQTVSEKQLSEQLIANNDGPFKQALDHYKYWTRFPERTQQDYRSQTEEFLRQLESTLTKRPFLLGEHSRLPDQAIFPFIRQFANVDRAWFDAAPYPHLRRWLQEHLSSTLFESVMYKYPQWQAHDEPILVQFSELAA
ncbi:MAG: glutathione S-transferase [Pseudomonadales bacterium]